MRIGNRDLSILEIQRMSHLNKFAMWNRFFNFTLIKKNWFYVHRGKTTMTLHDSLFLSLF